MTDFLEMAMADIDDVFFQEFVEQHGLHCLHGLDLVYAEKGPLAAADPRSRRM